LPVVHQVAIQGGHMRRVAFGMSIFGVTMAVPFVALALFPARVQSLPRAGEWMHTLKVFLGFIEIAAALKFLSNVDQVLNDPNVVLNRELFLVLLSGVLLVAVLYFLSVVRLEEERDTVALPV